MDPQFGTHKKQAEPATVYPAEFDISIESDIHTTEPLAADEIVEFLDSESKEPDTANTKSKILPRVRFLWRQAKVWLLSHEESQIRKKTKESQSLVHRLRDQWQHGVRAVNIEIDMAPGRLVKDTKKNPNAATEAALDDLNEVGVFLNSDEALTLFVDL